MTSSKIEVRQSGIKTFCQLGLYRFLHKMTSYLANRNPRRFCTVIGDHIGDTILTFGQYEKEILSIVSKVLSMHKTEYLKPTETGVVLDIGANIGNHSVAFSEMTDLVMSFEPNPATFKILEANVILNSISNVRTYNLGLSDQAGKNTLREIQGNNNLGVATIEPLQTGAKYIERTINLMRGDSFLNENLPSPHHRLMLIKIDVEGHEEQVLRGLSETLSSKDPIIMFEAHSDSYAAKIIEDLRAHQYSYFYSISNNYKRSLGALRKILQILFFGKITSLNEITTLDRGYYTAILAFKERPSYLAKT